MQRNSKTLPNPASTVIDRSFVQRLSQRRVEREVEVLMEADQREHSLIKLFRELPVERQRDVLAIVDVYHQQHGIDD
jgi:superfamily II RNA helicase